MSMLVMRCVAARPAEKSCSINDHADQDSHGCWIPCSFDILREFVRRRRLGIVLCIGPSSWYQCLYAAEPHPETGHRQCPCGYSLSHVPFAFGILSEGASCYLPYRAKYLLR